MDNATRQQHFISQMEQRLNASNPAANPENQRIYEFKVVDREQHVLELTDVRGKSIAKTLSMFDLFSFDVDKNSDTRANFEAVFYRYESRLAGQHGSSAAGTFRAKCLGEPGGL